MSQRFCRAESLALDDPLVGSGAHHPRNLLLSWPRAKWQRNLRKASDMPPALAEELDALVDAGRRVNLIHRRHQPERTHRLYLMPERRAFEVPRAELAAFVGALRRGEPLDAWHPSTVEQDLLLCCTHGKKDKCCAKFGFAAYKALAAAVQRHALPFDVWESSHLGGCRLAASVLLLPQLRKYGRVEPQHVLPLLESEARGQPYLPCYRGDSRLTPLQQCAQVAALEWLQRRFDDARIQGVETTAADQAGHGDQHRLEVAWRTEARGGRLTVLCQATELLRHDTCADLADTPSPSLVWRALAVEQVHQAQA